MLSGKPRWTSKTYDGIAILAVNQAALKHSHANGRMSGPALGTK